MRGSVQQVRDESGALDPHVFEIGGFASATAPESAQTVQATTSGQPGATPMQYVAQPATPERASEAQPVTTRQLLSQLRARLRVVEREIKVRQALESERAQIQRLIAAAKNERNNVRAIRAAG